VFVNRGFAQKTAQQQRGWRGWEWKRDVTDLLGKPQVCPQPLAAVVRVFKPQVEDADVLNALGKLVLADQLAAGVVSAGSHVS
jgi:hypothetical protein